MLSISGGIVKLVSNRYNLTMSEEDKLQDLIERLGHLHRSYLREFAYSVGLNLRQIESLIYLAKCNRYSDTPLALAEYLGLTKGTVSQTVIALEKKKLLKKRDDKSDGRVQHLQLTSSAHKLVRDGVRSSHINHSLKSFPHIAEPLKQNLLELLTAIQRTHNSRTFSVCCTCCHFRRNGLEQSHQCGLTGEPLHEHESLKICREHSDASDTD